MHLIFYSIFRFFGFFISQLSYRQLHALGNCLGLLGFHLHRSFRKTALSNLAIAYGESKSEEERIQIAKQSFQNVMITCLEFFRFKKSCRNISEIAVLEDNPEVDALLKQGQGVIFLSGHQSNWEIPFLALTERYSGIAIGRPIKNRRLYEWVLSVRQMHGGKIFMPKNAVKEGLRALKNGKFLGIVGDQAYPSSPYSYPLFGTRAWTASTPALLAYKTGSPLVVGTTKRENGRYLISGSHPIWPNTEAPIKEEVPRMMDAALAILEKSIQATPSQWMWIHDRWKQQEIDHVKRQYRYGFVLITLPKNPEPFLEILPIFRSIYPRSFLTFYVPKGTLIQLEDCVVVEYENESDLFVRDFRYQLLLDFYDSKKLRQHFLKLGVFKALSLHTMEAKNTLKETILHTLVKAECLKTVSF